MSYNPRLHRFAQFTAACTLFLLFAGGMVTSTGSGLSVPDWPLSYGMVFPPMVGGVFYEHGHRMIASFVGLLTVILCVWVSFTESRRWVRWVALSALGAVICQGILGGITVIFLLPTPVSVGHAALAEIFFCLTISLALFTAREWTEVGPHQIEHAKNKNFRGWAMATVIVVYLQILAGALMRHTGSGLAIPDFPLNYGHLLPPQWPAPVVINFVHRAGALVVLFFIAVVGTKALRYYRGQTKMTLPAIWMKSLLIVQIALGATTVWTQKNPTIATLHLAVGAMILAASVILMLRSFRHLAPAPQKIEIHEAACVS